MENMNFLDLDNDILNIIGGYVKKDNIERDFQEYKEKMKQHLFECVDIGMMIERKKARKVKQYMGRPYIRYQIWVYFEKYCHVRYGTEYLNDHDNYSEINNFYNEYLTLKKLNLKKPDFKI